MSFIVDVNRVSDMEVKGANRRGNSSTNTQAETIYEKLKTAAQDGDIERLYKLIAEDPNILGHFDEVPFYETPLHIAAEKGQNLFAMELMTLKPSLASKLNVSGFSPMHLALQNNHMQMVRWFVAFDSSLVRVKGRGRITPLHHVAEIGDEELLGEFLFACPSSVDDLTITGETAVHVAVRNQKLKAFKVLLGWLKRVNKKEILDWKDKDGNTVFHIAALTKQTEVRKLLGKIVKVNAKNLEGKTAKDILQSHQPFCFHQPRSILHNVKERLICCSTETLGEYLGKDISFMEKRNNLLGLSNLSLTRERSVNTSNRRDAILVVAILLVTATYQSGLSPPGGFWQDGKNGKNAGEMIMPYYNALFFVVLNGIGFLSSIYAITTLIIGLPMWKLIYGAMAALTVAMLTSYVTIFPNAISEDEMRKNPTESNVINRRIITAGFVIFVSPLIIGVMLIGTFMAFMVHKRRRNRVDFPASCFRRSVKTDRGFYIFSFGICAAFILFFILVVYKKVCNAIYWIL